MVQLIWIGLFLPLIGFLFLFMIADSIRRRLTAYIACGTLLLSFACFTGLLHLYTNEQLKPITLTLFKWIHVQGINADFTLHLDPLSLLMTLIITGVGSLIHIYSIGYMDHEEDYARFFAFLNFFVFAMLLLVLAGNLLLLFVGWEGVGLASYLLIGFWYKRPSAARAATKAFVVNRIGDLGFLLGLLLTFHLFGTSDIETITQQAKTTFAVGAPIIGVLTLLYFVGATGKSAQIPLQTWLPDAMEGPTPVSALIHAATMVTAGVYLIVRLHPLFFLAPDTLHLVGYVGAATALFAALCAMGQTDLKRVLAYSTMSQLGLMFLACGASAFYAAMFHLTTHAFMKALLFLSAGNVVHMMHGNTEMAKMGGLSQKFNKTHVLFLIGVLAMSGIPPFAAFFSKDLILEEEYLSGYHTLFYVGILVSVLTAFYLSRAYFLTFMGTPRADQEELKSVREAPPVMLIPVTVLAVLSVLGGFLGFSLDKPPAFEDFLAEVDVTYANKELLHTGFHLTPETWLSIFVAFFGFGSAALLYTRFYDRLGSTVQFLRKAFYIDEIYHVLIVTPLETLSRFIVKFMEPKIFDGSIHLATRTTQTAAGALQLLQSGQIRSYIAWMAIGFVVMLLYFIFI